MPHFLLWEPVLSGRESAAPVLGRVTGEGVLGRLREGVTPVLSSVTGEPVLSGRESAAPVLGRVTPVLTGEPVLSGRESAAPVLGRMKGEGVLGRLGEGVTPVLSGVFRELVGG